MAHTEQLLIVSLISLKRLVVTILAPIKTRCKLDPKGCQTKVLWSETLEATGVSS